MFAFTIKGIEVDLSTLIKEDFTVACRMLNEIEATMTEQEQIAHTWITHLLRSSGRISEYAEWKLVTYSRFCPEFTWVPIPGTTRTHGGLAQAVGPFVVGCSGTAGISSIDQLPETVGNPPEVLTGQQRSIFGQQGRCPSEINGIPTRSIFLRAGVRRRAVGHPVL